VKSLSQNDTAVELLRGAALALCMTALIVAALKLEVFGGSGPRRPELDTISYVLLALCGLSLVPRTRWPLVSLGMLVALGTAYISDGGPIPYLIPFMFVVFYSVMVNAELPRVQTIVLLAFSAGIFGVAISTTGQGRFDEGRAMDVAWVSIAIFLGDSIRSRRELIREAELRAEAAEREREEEARRRVSEERLQIARELHDVVAHSLALINVQAGVAGHLLDRDPGQAKEAFGNIKQSSHDALQELRALLGVLRQPLESAPLVPTTGLSSLDRLVEAVRDAGQSVDLSVTGEAPYLPATVDLSAYRILQEALTNTVRHAPGASVSVHIDYGKDGVELEVKNSRGLDHAPRSPGTGHGLTGMRERAAAINGQLEAGPDDVGGFRVHAVLPVPGGSGA
jgi:signal transduction histidine kinase